MKTKLKDYELWFDGDISVEPTNLVSFIQKLPTQIEHLHVNDEDANVVHYNRLVPKNKKIGIKTHNRPFNFDWNIPEEFKQIDVEQHLIQALATEFQTNSFSIDEENIRILRVHQELQLYRKYNLIDVLKAINFIINTLERSNIVWGVGRGSSVSSYILYLLKVHDVDSVKYELDIKEFMN